MNAHFQRLCVWAAVAFIALFFVSNLPMSHLLPPHSPGLSGAQVQALFANNLIGMRLAMPVAYIAAMLILPWSAVLAVQVARIEGKFPVMAITVFGAGVADCVAFFLPFVFWAGAFYRTNLDPRIFQFVDDTCWLEYVMLVSPFLLQTLAVALVGFTDKSPNPVFPRWFCYFSLWADILISPGELAGLFTSGPMAWNGLLSYWLPTIMFVIYYAILIPLMFKGIRRQELEAA